MLWRIYAVVVFVGLIIFSLWLVQDWRGKKHFAQEHSQVALLQTARQVAATVTQPDAQVNTSTLLQKTLLNDPRWKVVFISSPQIGTEFYWGPPPAPRSTSENSSYVPLPSWKPDFFTQVESSVLIPHTAASQQLTGIRQFFGEVDLFNAMRAFAVFLTVLTLITGIFLLIATLKASADSSSVDTPVALDLDPTQNRAQYPSSAHAKTWDWDYDLPDIETFEEPKQEDASPSVSKNNVDTPWAELTLEELDFSSPAGTPVDQHSGNRGEQRQNDVKARLRELSQALPDQDLSVIAFARLPLGNPQETARRLFDAVGSQEGFETPSFYAVILPGIGLETALQKAKAASLALPGVVAGVSALSGRATFAETLLDEAERALQRAVETARPALGYKVLTQHSWV